MLKRQFCNEIIERLDTIIRLLKDSNGVKKDKQNPLKQVKSSGILEWLDSRNKSN